MHRWIEGHILLANARIICTDVIVHGVPISGRAPRCHRRAIAEHRVLEPIVLAFDIPWIVEPIDYIRQLRIVLLECLTIVELEADRVEDAVAVGVDQTVELTLKHFASDRCSMVASTAVQEKVLAVDGSIDHTFDEVGEPILADDNDLSLLVLEVLLVTNRYRRILDEQLSNVDDIEVVMMDLRHLPHKPISVLDTPRHNRDVLHHGEEHDIECD